MITISELLYKKITRSLSPEEELTLQKWIESHPENARLAEKLCDPEFLSEWIDRRKTVDTVRPLADMEHRAAALESRSRRKVWLRAASVIALVAIGAATVIGLRHGQNADLSPQSITQSELTFATIKPGQTIAEIKNSSNQTVALNASDTSHVISSLMPLTPAEKICVDVPRGGEFKIILEDSTVVWLNSESQLHYPSSFGDKERRVTITGEAYFIVAHENDRPFYVETQGQQIRVYGTTFNVKAYPDDEAIYTTLENGSIALARAQEPGGELYISPGHQALFLKSDCSVKMKAVNPDAITAWRHGRFVFEEQNLRNIMRDLARWYDFEYVFDDPDLEEIVFMGSIPRYSDFNVAKTILERTGDIMLTIGNGIVHVAAPRGVVKI